MAKAYTHFDTPHPASATMPIGVVLERRPGVTRWAKYVWRAVAVLPGAKPADFRTLRDADGVAEFHAATLPLTLYRSDVEGYRVSLAMTPPSVFVVLRLDAATRHGIDVHKVTASSYEAQDHCDSGEEIVEPVPMPEGLAAWVSAFCDANYVETEFVKRKRGDKGGEGAPEDGVGDARIRQLSDVYRAPGEQKPNRSGT